jgi:anti-anti-sigma regulatory factor
MLRITVRDGDNIRIIVEGKLVSAWVDELRNCCRTVLSHSQPQNVLVDLADVSFVDAAGKNLLAGLARQGIRLTSDDAAMDALVSDIVKKSPYQH